MRRWPPWWSARSAAPLNPVAVALGPAERRRCCRTAAIPHRAGQGLTPSSVGPVTSPPRPARLRPSNRRSSRTTAPLIEALRSSVSDRGSGRVARDQGRRDRQTPDPTGTGRSSRSASAIALSGVAAVAGGRRRHRGGKPKQKVKHQHRGMRRRPACRHRREGVVAGGGTASWSVPRLRSPRPPAAASTVTKRTGAGIRRCGPSDAPARSIADNAGPEGAVVAQRLSA